MTDEVNPKAYPFGAGEVPTLAKRAVSRSSSDESVSKELVNILTSTTLWRVKLLT